MLFNILFKFVFLFCIFVSYFVDSVLLYCFVNFFLLLYIAVSILFLYKFTDYCHLVETQLQ